ncbi:MAG TPA: hypothetical protein VFB60_06430 [Ktedonobacteraceae bacterium]|nr:hypothetical protein [Ktedonobacteraceae bacterium]
MRKIFLSRVVALQTLLLTTLAFMLSGSPAGYAASHQAAGVPASITVAENPLTEDTAGNFIATVNGRGLHKNTNYVLTDNNFSCTDSINKAGSLVVTTDLGGRFSVIFLGGPSFFTTAPCLVGVFTITATLQVLPSTFVTGTFKLQPPSVFVPADQLYFSPNPVVILTNGEVVGTLYGRGWTPGKIFDAFLVTSTCGAVSSPAFSPVTVDGDGNFEFSVVGTGCSAGTVELMVVVGTASRLIDWHLAAPSL